MQFFKRRPKIHGCIVFSWGNKVISDVPSSGIDLVAFFYHNKPVAPCSTYQLGLEFSSRYIYFF